MVQRADVMPAGSEARAEVSKRRRGPRHAAIAFVCRANRCRSPLAEHLTRLRAEQQGLAVVVTSMGFLPSGLPVPAAGVRAAAEYGVDLSQHSSRQLDLGYLEEADVVLALSRAAARDLVAQDAALWPKVYTLKQFAAQAAARPAAPGADFPVWVRQLGETRQRSVLLGDSTDDDVADPMGRPPRVWRRTIEEIDGLIDQVLSSSAQALPVSQPVSP